MATPISYLQTLSSTEAGAFITSLQKVQAHLQQELAWMNHQVQQKTMQLQGIETLLTEATTSEPTAPAAAETVAPTQAQPSGKTDVEAAAAASEGVSAKEVASSPAQVAAPPATAQGKKTAAKPSAKAKSPKSSSAKATTKKSPSAKTPSSSKARKTQAEPKSRALLRPEFADTSLTDGVTQILTQAGEPLHLDQLVSELYEDVSGEDLKRIKKALANVLSKLPCTHKSCLYSSIEVIHGVWTRMNPLQIHAEQIDGTAFGDPRLVKRGSRCMTPSAPIVPSIFVRLAKPEQSKWDFIDS